MFPDSEKYEPIIGLEVHAQLLTHSKAFSSDSSEFGKEPNSNISIVSLGLPGTLPMLNSRVVECAVMLGLATTSTISRKFSFDRKNYFYTDLPKGYQISQDKEPICTRGFIEIKNDHKQKKKINLTRIHIEEDAGKSIHDLDPFKTLIDLNRAGVPLLEIVSEPEINSGSEAYNYLYEIRRLVRHLNICDGNMEEGSLRCDANVSVRLKGSTELGTRVEIKNINSLNYVRKAIDNEISRQIGLIENGKPVQRQTMGYDASRNKLYPLRSKEEAHDYRYFPEPDLPPFAIDESYINRIRNEMIVLPQEWENKFTVDMELSDYDAGLLADDKEVSRFFDEICQYTKLYKAAANWILGPVKSAMKEKKKSIGELKISPLQLARLIELIDEGKLSNTIAQQNIFPLLLKGTDSDPYEIALQNDWIQESNTLKLQSSIIEILNKYPEKVKEYRNGKKGLIGMFIGELMKVTGGKADPKVASEILRSLLDE